MLRYVQFQTILWVFCLQLTSACLSDEMAIFCHGELYHHHYEPNEGFVRELVVPEGGIYHLYTTMYSSDKRLHLSPDEVKILKLLHQKVSTCMFIQISKPEQQAKPHLEAWGAALHDEIGTPSVIRPLWGLTGEKTDIFDLLDKLTHLRHLELYAFIIDSDNFSEITKLTVLEYLGLPTNADDKHLRHIAGLKKLKFLNASGTEIKGKGLPTLAGLPQLRILDLRGTRLDSGALAGLKTSKSLETLLLSYSNVKDRDLKDLIGFDTLKFLTLHRTSLTDEGLKILASLKNLKYASVYSTKTTKLGRESLLKSSPGLTLDVTCPLTPLGFLLERRLCHAYLGDMRAQKIVADDYYSGIGMLWPKDLIESLKWYYLLKEQCPKSHLDEISERIKSIEKELDRKGIAEAKTRARAVSFVRNKSKFNYEIERTEGLPIYQYEFETVEIE